MKKDFFKILSITFFLMLAIIVNECFGYAGTTLSHLADQKSGYALTVSGLVILGVSLIIPILSLAMEKQLKKGKVILDILLFTLVTGAFVMLFAGMISFAVNWSKADGRAVGVWIGVTLLYLLGYISYFIVFVKTIKSSK